MDVHGHRRGPPGRPRPGRPVTTNNSLENGDRGRNRLRDGVLTSAPGAKGCTSNDFSSADVGASPVRIEVDLGADTDLDAVRLFPRTDTGAAGGGTADFPVDFTLQIRPDGGMAYSTVRIDFSSADVSGTPVWIEVDLGADRAIGSVTLHPRTDTGAAGGGTAGFPVGFTLRTRADGATAHSTARTVTGQADPNGAAQTYTLTSATGRYLRLQTTRLGAPASDESAKYRLQLAEIRIQ